MHLGSLERDAERRGDVLVAEPLGNQLQHLDLAAGQCLVREAVGEDALHIGRQPVAAAVHIAHHASQLVEDRFLEQVAGRASGHGAVDVLVTVIHRQHDDAGIRRFGPDGMDGVEAAHDRHLQVHQHDVGPMRTTEIERLHAVGDGAHHHHVVLPRQQGGDALAHDAMVVDADDADAVIERRKRHRRRSGRGHQSIFARHG